MTASNLIVESKLSDVSRGESNLHRGFRRSLPEAAIHQGEHFMTSVHTVNRISHGGQVNRMGSSPAA